MSLFIRFEAYDGHMKIIWFVYYCFWFC